MTAQPDIAEFPTLPPASRRGLCISAARIQRIADMIGDVPDAVAEALATYAPRDMAELEMAEEIVCLRAVLRNTFSRTLARHLPNPIAVQLQRNVVSLRREIRAAAAALERLQSKPPAAQPGDQPEPSSAERATHGADTVPLPRTAPAPHSADQADPRHARSARANPKPAVHTPHPGVARTSPVPHQPEPTKAQRPDGVLEHPQAGDALARFASRRLDPDVSVGAEWFRALDDAAADTEQMALEAACDQRPRVPVERPAA